MRQRTIRMISRNITYIGCDLHRDHLGNVREVVSEKGEVKQVNAYYPFGTPIYALGTNKSQQRYKYNAISTTVRSSTNFTASTPTTTAHANTPRCCRCGIG